MFASCKGSSQLIVLENESEQNDKPLGSVSTGLNGDASSERNIYVTQAKWQQMISVFKLYSQTFKAQDKQDRADTIMRCKFCVQVSLFSFEQCMKPLKMTTMKKERKIKTQRHKMPVSLSAAFSFYQQTSLIYGAKCQSHAC